MMGKNLRRATKGNVTRCERNPPDRPYRCRARCSEARRSAPRTLVRTSPCEATGCGVRGHGMRGRGRASTVRCDRIASQQKCCDAVRTSLSSPRPVQRDPPHDRGPAVAANSQSPRGMRRNEPPPVALRSSDFPRARRSTRAAAELTRLVPPAGRALRLPAGVRLGQRAAASGAAVSAREWFWTR